VTGGIPDYESTESPVADQNIRAAAQKEVPNSIFTSDHDRVRQLITRSRLIKEIGRTTDLKRRIGAQYDVFANSIRS
jgi:hypothetical protein